MLHDVMPRIDPAIRHDLLTYLARINPTIRTVEGTPARLVEIPGDPEDLGVRQASIVAAGEAAVAAWAAGVVDRSDAVPAVVRYVKNRLFVQLLDTGFEQLNPAMMRRNPKGERDEYGLGVRVAHSRQPEQVGMALYMATEQKLRLLPGVVLLDGTHPAGHGGTTRRPSLTEGTRPDLSIEL